jgi:hypothetical protein
MQATASNGLRFGGARWRMRRRPWSRPSRARNAATPRWDHADGRLPVLLRSQTLRHAAAAEARPLVRFLLIRQRAVPADAAAGRQPLRPPPPPSCPHLAPSTSRYGNRLFMRPVCSPTRAGDHWLPTPSLRDPPSRPDGGAASARLTPGVRAALTRQRSSDLDPPGSDPVRPHP